MCNCRDYFGFKVTVNIILHYISFFITIQRKREKLVKLQIVIVLGASFLSLSIIIGTSLLQNDHIKLPNSYL